MTEPARLGVAAPAVPRPPKGLRAAGRRFWRSTTATFELEDHHQRLLEEACRTLDVVRAAETAIASDGEYVEGRFGPKAHPAVIVRDRNRVTFARLVRELGLDIAAPAASRPSSSAPACSAVRGRGSRRTFAGGIDERADVAQGAFPCLGEIPTGRRSAASCRASRGTRIFWGGRPTQYRTAAMNLGRQVRDFRLRGPRGGSPREGRSSEFRSAPAARCAAP